MIKIPNQCNGCPFEREIAWDCKYYKREFTNASKKPRFCKVKYLLEPDEILELIEPKIKDMRFSLNPWAVGYIEGLKELKNAIKRMCK